MSPMRLPGHGRGDAGHHRGTRSCPRDRSTSGRRGADEERPGAVAVPALVDGPGVDRHDLAVADHPLAGDAVDDLVVERDAEAGRIAVVALERRHGAVAADVPLGDPVEMAGGDAGLQLRLDEREHLGDDPAGTAHLVDLLARLAGDHGSGRLRLGGEAVEQRLGDGVDGLAAVDRAAGRPRDGSGPRPRGTAAAGRRAGPGRPRG